MEKKENPSLIAIDPGVILGWAFWPAKMKYPTKCGVVKPMKKTKNFFEDMHSTIHQIAKIILERKPEFVAVEWPAFFDSAGGRAAAGSGSVIKLAFGIGQLALAADACNARFVPIDVSKWKGQLSKRIVTKRIKERMSKARIEYLNPESHSWDAIGIGLYCRGLF